ncbi:MAG: transketolase C-terminal domain-containing protein [Bacillota bacterium]|nr:transketolase C-terminal domain-containing protein [Bacillota bacterium]
MIKIIERVSTSVHEPVALRDAFVTALIHMGEHPDFIYLDADLMSSVGTRQWALAHPDKAFNMGVAEANMIGVAAGLAAAGFRPLVHTFGAFAARRCYDQAFLAVGYSGFAVTIIGSDPGVTAAFNGGTHMPFEDVALYRAIPGSTVLETTDAAMLTSVLPQAWQLPGLKYIRVGRKPVLPVYEPENSFQIGQAVCLREGNDAVIIACGILVVHALEAAEMLQQEGLTVAVLDCFTIKPLDREAVCHWAEHTGAVVTAENHNINGGLGSAVAELLSDCRPCPLERIGIYESFGEVGPQDYLETRFGLTTLHIADKVRTVMKRKLKCKQGGLTL